MRLVYPYWKWVVFHVWKETVCPFTAFLSDYVVLQLLSVHLLYKCKCVKKLLKPTWFLHIHFCLDDPSEAGVWGGLLFVNWNNKFISWLGNYCYSLVLKCRLRKLLQISSVYCFIDTPSCRQPIVLSICLILSLLPHCRPNPAKAPSKQTIRTKKQANKHIHVAKAMS